jgi:putative ABC transport system permease protein
MRLPGWARAVLSLAPLRDLRDDIEADLAELFGDRRARYGFGYAHRRLSGDILSLWRGNLRGGTMLRDLRFGWRLIRRHPAPVAIGIGGLALAIGAVTSVFTLVDATMLRPHGMQDPSSVVRVVVPGHGSFSYWPYRTFLRLQDEASLSQVEASLFEKARLSTGAPADDVPGRWMLFVSGTYHQTFGARPALGRILQPADDVPGAMAVIVVSHHLWSTEFNADPSAIGRTVWVNGAPVTLVGVLERGFTGPISTRASVWAPLSAFDDVGMGTAFQPTSTAYVEVFARLASDATMEAARDNLDAIVKRSRSGSSHAPEGDSGSVLLRSAASPIDAEGPDGYVAIASISGVLGLVLALACANTANLLLAGAATRTREIGIRLAMGSTARRLIRQMVSESVLLGLMAGALGLLLSAWLTPILRSVVELPPDLDVSLDARVLLFATGVALICGIAAGISPARFGARGDVLSALKTHRSSRDRRTAPSRLRTSFVGFQAAASMLLLVSAALLSRTAIQAMRTEAGFDVNRLLTVSISDGRTKFDEIGYLQSALTALRGMRAVERVAVTQYIPFGFSVWRDVFTHRGHSYTLYFNRTDAEYFATAGVRLLRGRTFAAEEVADERPVAVISESVARAFFDGIDPVGQQVSRVPGEDARQIPATIIGVVADAMISRLRTEQFGAIYLPLERTRSNTPGLLVRTASPGIASRAVEDALRRIDPRVRVTTAIVGEQVDAYLAEKRMLAWLAGPTALLALVLAMLGLYGVTAFAVSHRSQEMSIRTAIGATTADLLRLLVRDGLRPVLVGLAIGLFAALVVSRLFASTLPGVSPHDPLAIGAAIVTLFSSALAAILIPARRVANTDPASVLRQA